MQEAYSREESSIGWWPADDVHGPVFYAFTYPAPAGYESAAVRPTGATYDPDSASSSCPTMWFVQAPTRTPPCSSSSRRRMKSAPTWGTGIVPR